MNGIDEILQPVKECCEKEGLYFGPIAVHENGKIIIGVKHPKWTEHFSHLGTPQECVDKFFEFINSEKETIVDSHHKNEHIPVARRKGLLSWDD